MATKTELAYIAGFFDGEGWISLVNSRPLVGIGQADPKILKEIQQVMGFGHITANRPHGRLYYRWRVGQKAHVSEFIRLIYPYSRHKEKRRRMRVVRSGKLEGFYP